MLGEDREAGGSLRKRRPRPQVDSAVCHGLFAVAPGPDPWFPLSVFGKVLLPTRVEFFGREGRGLESYMNTQAANGVPTIWIT